MKTFRDFLEDDNTELEERVDSMMTRLKRAKAARKNKNKMKIARKIASKKIKIDKKTIDRRAQKKARLVLKKKRLRGKSEKDLGMGQKIALSKFLDKKTAAISRIAKKLRKGLIKQELQKKRKKPIEKANKNAIPQK